MNYIYLDNAATTQVDPTILDTFLSSSVEIWGNPTGLHRVGQKARASLENSRKKCAKVLGVNSQEIYFTSTATESNNLAIQGTISYFVKLNQRPHILISSLEHASVSDFASNLDCDIEFFQTKPNGICSVDELVLLFRPETVLVSMMLVSNEIGTIQPVKELCEKLRSINSVRKDKNLPEIKVHSDCVQAPLYLDLNLAQMGVDFAVISGHKLYSPRGSALLFKKESGVLAKTNFGGGQERGLRSGTQNVASVACLAQSLEMAQNSREQEVIRIQKLKDSLIIFFTQFLPQANINGDLNQRIVNNIHVTIPNVDEEELLMKLDLSGIAVSSGSSCSSGSHKKDGISNRLPGAIDGADIRITLGKYNTKEEVDYFCITLLEAIKDLSQINFQ
jgi:cysteine desulfurase